MSGTYTTNVPAATFGPTGFIAPPETAILPGVQADIDAAFGGGVNPALSTPQGQLASSQTAIIGEGNDQLLLLTNACDPAYAEGRFQDALGRIYFIDRLSAQPTVLQVACLGLSGVAITPANTTLQDGQQNLIVPVTGGTIPASGTVTLAFAFVVGGPIAVPPSSDLVIYKSPGGLDTVTVVSGVLGSVVESRADFEFRRQQSVAKNSVGSLPSIRGAVLAVPGVLDVYAAENDTNAAVSTGGVSLNANCLYVAVVGGDPATIAQAIWTKKMPGCPYYSAGNTTVTVLDTDPSYTAPYPPYPVTFEIPAATPIYFAVTISQGASVPADALTQVQNAIMAAFSGADGGQRARIGSKLYASRFYAGIGNLGAWAQIVEVLIGTAPQPTGFFVQMQINQVPTIAAGNITLALQ